MIRVKWFFISVLIFEILGYSIMAALIGFTGKSYELLLKLPHQTLLLMSTIGSIFLAVVGPPAFEFFRKNSTKQSRKHGLTFALIFVFVFGIELLFIFQTSEISESKLYISAALATLAAVVPMIFLKRHSNNKGESIR